jgi:hypothetical protein
MFVNLLKSSILLPLLAQLIETLHRLNFTDPKPERLANQLQLFIAHPNHANGQELVRLLDQIRELLISYGVKPNHQLSEMLFVIHEELQDLLNQAQIAQSTFDQSTAGTFVVAKAEDVAINLAIQFRKATTE